MWRETKPEIFHFRPMTSHWFCQTLLSSLQALHHTEYDHPILTQTHEMYSYLIRDGKEVVFVLVPGHVGVNDDSAANSAAKNALDGDVSDNYIPFSDLKPRLNNYIIEL